ncbi:MAG: serine/threonine-protein kinase [Rubripirellula sp.]
MNAAQHQFGDCSFTQIADAYIQMRREGQTISVEDFAKALPDLEEEIRTKLPALLLLEDTLGADREPKIAVGQNVSGCVIEAEIGRGAMGCVYRAYQPEFDRQVAVKVLREKGTSRNQETRFSIERQAMARLDHPHIVQAYAYTQDADCDCLVMKLVDGYSLAQLIRSDCDFDGRKIGWQLVSDWEAFAELGANVASGLAHAHENGLIHRDIKPSNLLIDKSGKVWISDFGLVKMQDVDRSLSKTGDLIGTPRYMAPEQMFGACDDRSDIYSLGVTLYELAAKSSVTGANWTKFLCDGPEPALMNIREKNPDVPEDLAKVIMKACAFAPDDRYQTAEEFHIVLERFRSGRVADRRKGKRKKNAIYRRSVKRMVMAAVLTAIGVGWGAAYTVGQRDQPKAQEVPKETSDFLDMLVDSPEEGFGKVVRTSFLKSVDDAADKIQLPKQEKVVLRSKLDQMLQKSDEHEITPQSFNSLITKYKDSSLFAGAKWLRITSVISRSGLTFQEKEAAQLTLRRYSFLVAKERIPKQEAERSLQAFTYGQEMTTAELDSAEFADERIRSWVLQLEERVGELLAPGEAISVGREIDSIFQELERS